MQLHSYLILIIKTLRIKLRFSLHAYVDFAIIRETFFLPNCHNVRLFFFVKMYRWCSSRHSLISRSSLFCPSCVRVRVIHFMCGSQAQLQGNRTSMEHITTAGMITDYRDKHRATYEMQNTNVHLNSMI
jgi:hypothetical protein